MADPHTNEKSPSPVAQIWRRAVLAQRGYAHLNRATHGALSFNTAAKALAWVGLCAIVLLLLHKVHQIQLELDPVGRGLQQLQQELRTAKAGVEADTQASERELDSLRTRTQSLESALDKASAEERENGAPALLRADREARELADAIAQEAEAIHALESQRTSMTATLTDYQRTMTQSQQAAQVELGQLADAGALANRGLQTLSEAAAKDALKLQDSVDHSGLGDLAAKSRALQSEMTALQQDLEQLDERLKGLPVAPARVAAAKPQQRAN